MLMTTPWKQKNATNEQTAAAASGRGKIVTLTLTLTHYPNCSPLVTHHYVLTSVCVCLELAVVLTPLWPWPFTLIALDS